MEFEYKGTRASVYKSKRKTASIQLKPSEIVVRVPEQMSEKEIKEFVLKHGSWIEIHQKLLKEEQKQAMQEPKLTYEEIKALADKAMTVIPEKVRRYAPLIGVNYHGITIRNQRTRWGSCSSKGNLNFNCLLMLAPDEVIDSVVVHELCHRKHMNHSQSFYTEVYKAFPEYDRCHRWLQENGSRLLGRL